MVRLNLFPVHVSMPCSHAKYASPWKTSSERLGSATKARGGEAAALESVSTSFVNSITATPSPSERIAAKGR